ncbi:hypothetical protein Salat_0233600 [Sesamum alatum]|uniref:Uncharacterized protein n=1 Tax=Sesamum alatum TaxID=300844 RepID=A0AAE1YYD5_9LAMI|nr:hypothetical protein Salat_0233600 [Sesamum alatum]
MWERSGRGLTRCSAESSRLKKLTAERLMVVGCVSTSPFCSTVETTVRARFFLTRDWKYRVFHLPSATHLTADFCFQKSSYIDKAHWKTVVARFIANNLSSDGF